MKSNFEAANMMKRTTTTIGLILLALILKAQSLELGLKTGVGIANTHITNLPETENHSDIFSPILSYSFNGTISYRSKGLLGVTVEPGIIQKGWYSFKGNDNENKFIIQYFQLPFLSDFYVSDKLFFSIGPELNYLLNAKNKSNYGTEKITELNRKFELAGLIGCAYKIHNNLDIGLRYSHGLTQTSEKVFWVLDEFGENPVKMKNYNRYLQIFINVNFKNL